MVDRKAVERPRPGLLPTSQRQLKNPAALADGPVPEALYFFSV